MKKKPRKPKSPALNVPLITAVALGCFLVAWAMKPSDDELAKRLSHDGQLERLRQLAAKHGAGTAERGLFKFLVEHVLSEELTGDDRATLGALFEKMEEPQQLLNSLHSVEMSPKKARQLYEALANRELAIERPDLAADTYAAFHERYAPSPETLTKHTEALRFCSQPREAYELLLANEQLLQDPTLRELAKTVGAESGDYSLALRDSLEGVADLEPSMVEQSALEELVRIALAQNEPERAVPILERCFSAIEGAEVELGDLASLLEESPAAGMTDRYDFLSAELSKLHLWSEGADRAFVLRARRAMLGDAEALAWCVESFRPLCKLEEMEIVFRTADIGDDSTTLRARADLSLSGNDFASAIADYKVLAEEKADDAEVWMRLGYAYDAHGDLTEAAACLGKAAKLDVEENAVDRKWIDSLLTVRAYHGALAGYARMTKFDSDVAEDYTDVSRLLGDFRHLVRASLMQIAAAPDSQELWIDLSKLYAEARSEKGLSTLQKRALKRFKRSAPIRMAFADAWQGMRRHDEAMKLLMTPELRKDPEIVARLVDLAEVAKSGSSILKFLGDRIWLSDLSTTTRATIAELLISDGRTTEAMRMLETAKEFPGAYGSLAFLHYKRADLSKAANYQLAHVETAGRQDPAAWKFLGDLLKENGQASAASKAYRRSLSVTAERL